MFLDSKTLPASPYGCHRLLNLLQTVEGVVRQGLRLDQQTLSFVAAPALAEAHDHGMPGAFRLDPARE
jgi:hypothetical protein